ncbi:MAG: hypothetical protein CfP315_0728 [Candidatus Improbicoccus pseudotrichonymphae]|uniref:Uncharacterized protein n=1 Tax=Candidatus Improbicoccus pseudotrichonymphae TaxID=3033792 RepID=A0AA48I4V3_9FIRM|nr:MAG: hypothetical protein CfP315_0728 [Candidatus Improbicoccus pseudotrichonymphae]
MTLDQSISEKIISVFEKILDNAELTREFSKIDNVRSMFDFCQSIESGYTFEQFDEFLVESMKQISKMSKNEIESILFEKISGGSSCNKNEASGIANLLTSSLANNIHDVSRAVADEVE